MAKKKTADLFDKLSTSTKVNRPKKTVSYTAEDIEVLEGLQPVRKRPGMYIGGTDESSLHHLAAEVLDNAMDEAVAGYASSIEIYLDTDGSLTITDNGRGIPIEPHPKFKDKSALEVIMTTLHAGGKFSGKVYQTSGGLNGVGVSVVNALSEKLEIKVIRNQKLWAQTYERGIPTTELTQLKSATKKKGTSIKFIPDTEIFGENNQFSSRRLYELAQSKAYLFRGVKIHWSCGLDQKGNHDIPKEKTFHFPQGLLDFLFLQTENRNLVGSAIFEGQSKIENTDARLEWAICWPVDDTGLVSSYCNTVPTPNGGSHIIGMRSALTKALKSYGELTNKRKVNKITAEDVCDGVIIILSLFIPNPQFQGQTKERLSMPEAARLVESQIKDHFDLFLSSDTNAAEELLEWIIEKAEERKRKKDDRELIRKSPTRKLRLPGKLSDCTNRSHEGTELFIVEGDSAGGSAKQARNRQTQAILPLRGKILNVASATPEKLASNQELKDLVQALGCGSGKDLQIEKLRYERVIIMTDADVDGAHIASLLMTFFYREMPKLVTEGHLYLAVPPLYRLSRGGNIRYAQNEIEREKILTKDFSGNGKVEISRFKGLGEMPPNQLKETTMNPEKRSLIQVILPTLLSIKNEDKEEAKITAQLVEHLMGRKPEKRFNYIQQNAQFVSDVDI